MILYYIIFYYIIHIFYSIHLFFVLYIYIVLYMYIILYIHLYYYIYIYIYMNMTLDIQGKVDVVYTKCVSLYIYTLYCSTRSPSSVIHLERSASIYSQVQFHAWRLAREHGRKVPGITSHCEESFWMDIVCFNDQNIDLSICMYIYIYI